jgi:hypothetical protein
VSVSRRKTNPRTHKCPQGTKSVAGEEQVMSRLDDTTTRHTKPILWRDNVGYLGNFTSTKICNRFACVTFLDEKTKNCFE